MNEEDREFKTGLTTFSCKEAYVYKAPPATTGRHQAELWDVDNPMQEVACTVVTCGNDCWVRLTDKESGDLFAECPIVREKPLTASVDPVIDSSRYYVLRVVDRESGRHAFLGFGFRERSHATDFNAALSDHIGYLRRAREAREMQEAFEAAQSGQQGPNLPTLDFRLKPGETVSLKLADKAPLARSSFMSRRLAAVAIAEPGSNGALLPPPPAAGAKLEETSLSGPPSEGSSSAHGAAATISSPEGSTPVSCKASKQHAEGAEMRGDDGIRSLANKGQKQELKQSHSAPFKHPDGAVADEVDDDDDFGTFMNA
ncbi:hypothetical protein CVIRNUC_008715 [Coccomyxa viridis]|uniref:NECAP PHear domain-containing protein n=1 Tax=Coccomyxa viridis TaxID=1274662 RepID=A0AAV1IH14_9CHLO|nr:hypothetical protein CVIRNUC_008715 [Coccomyxa viridis]